MAKQTTIARIDVLFLKILIITNKKIIFSTEAPPKDFKITSFV